MNAPTRRHPLLITEAPTSCGSMEELVRVVTERQALFQRFSKVLMSAYPAIVVATEEGFRASHPDLPGCHADGATPKEAMSALSHVRHAWLSRCVSRGRPLPMPEHQRQRMRREDEDLLARVLRCA